MSTLSTQIPLRAREAMFGGVWMALTVDECVSALTGLGYEFSLRDDGSVSVKQPAKRNPRAAEMMAYLALHKEEVRAAVRDWGQRSLLPAEAPAQEDQGVINETLDMPVRFDQTPAASAVMLPEPDADGIVRLVRVSPEIAFAAGELINDGKAELIGNVIYRRLSNVFDVTYRVVES